MLGHCFFRQAPAVFRSAHRSYSMSPEQREALGTFALGSVMVTGSAAVLSAIFIMASELTGRGHAHRAHRHKKEAYPTTDCKLLLKTYLACVDKLDTSQVEGTEASKKPASP